MFNLHKPLPPSSGLNQLHSFQLLFSAPLSNQSPFFCSNLGLLLRKGHSECHRHSQQAVGRFVRLSHHPTTANVVLPPLSPSLMARMSTKRNQNQHKDSKMEDSRSTEGKAINNSNNNTTSALIEAHGQKQDLEKAFETYNQ